MTDDEKRLCERNEACSFATGYLYGCLRALQANSGVSATLQTEIDDRLAFIRPVIVKIYDLGQRDN